MENEDMSEGVLFIPRENDFRTHSFCMMAAAVIAGLRILQLPGFEARAQSATPADPQSVPRLKDIYARDFLIGAAIDFRRPDEFSSKELENIKSQFNIITPENSMKPASVHPSDKVWNWTEADRLVDFCQAYNIQLAGHTLVWHAQTGNWFFAGDDGKPASVR
jgi:GH35 family endo-1,4-beta-xylanase